MSTRIFLITRSQGHSLTFESGPSYYKDFKHLLKTTEQSVTRFDTERPGVEETKICLSHPSHMTNMATTPIYGRKFKKSSSPKPVDRWA